MYPIWNTMSLPFGAESFPMLATNPNPLYFPPSGAQSALVHAQVRI